MGQPKNAQGSGDVAARKRFGTFGGVFTPTLLTILGVIMYLRTGWVVGHSGVLGGWLVILVAMGISAATGLSVSSIATNTRIPAGGPYAIVSRALGLEVGGSVGVPLYLSQALAVAMYVFGFREGWLWLFPDHPALLVDVAVFGVMLALAWISASLTFRIQYVVMAVIALSLVLVLASPAGWSGLDDADWLGSAEDGDGALGFWPVFAVYFPAATGILAGVNMSGELADPRRSIPVGTLSAIAVATLVYLALGLWVAGAGSSAELQQEYTIVLDRSLWAPGVLAGLLGATFSSGVVSLVGAPRILMALGSDQLVPAGGWLSRPGANGEPRRALGVTAVVVLAALMLRDLNAVAPLITMFFLITYAVINVVVLIEDSLGLSSWRPTLRLPRVVPLAGAVGCVFAMFIVNPTFGLVAVTVVVALYMWILRQGVRGAGHVRSGIFVAFAEWAAIKATGLQFSTAQAWKPNLMVPVEDPAELRGEYGLILDIARPEGSVKLLGIATDSTVTNLTRRIADLGAGMRREGVFTTWSVLDAAEFKTGLVAGLQAMGSAFFRPNILFLDLPREGGRAEDVRHLWREARRLRSGVLLLARHPKAGLGRRRVINLWLAMPAPGASVPESLDQQGAQLSILAGYRLHRAWRGELNIVVVAPPDTDELAAHAFAAEVRDLSRLPHGARTVVLRGTLESCMPEAPQSDLDVIGLTGELDIARVQHLVELTRSACLFSCDSGLESALA